MNNNKGFTLVELMIVVAIVGILTMIVLPSYNGYIARSKLTEALSLVGELKKRVAEEVQVAGNANNANSHELGIGQFNTDVIESIAVIQGQITVTFKVSAGLGGTSGDKKVLVYEMSQTNNTDKTVWNCSSNLDQQIRPRSCDRAVVNIARAAAN